MNSEYLLTSYGRVVCQPDRQTDTQVLENYLDLFKKHNYYHELDTYLYSLAAVIIVFAQWS